MRINFHDPALCSFYEDELVAWLSSYADRFKKNGFVVGVSGGSNSSLVCHLCKKTGLKVRGVHLAGASPVTNLESLNLASLTSLSCYGNVNKNFSAVNTELSYLAETTNSLIAGTVDGTKGGLGRFHKKWGDGVGDLFPIAGIFKSDLETWASHLNLSVSPISHLELDPTSNSHEEDWGFSIEELEWAEEEEEHTSLVKSSGALTESPAWFTYFNTHKQVISKLRARHRRTGHKAIPTYLIPKLKD